MTSCTNDNDDNPVAPPETKQLAEYTILYYANGGGNVDRFILPMISDFYKVNPDAYKYQAEKTIWHETVAHHGLRELIGAQNQGTVP